MLHPTRSISTILPPDNPSCIPQLSRDDIEQRVESISVPTIDTWGDSKWLSLHVNLELLAIQVTVNVRLGTEETVSDAILQFNKIPALIHSLVRSRIWKSHVLPVVQSHLASHAPIIGYSLIHHETILLNVLQTVLFKQPAIPATGDALIDLIDIVAGWLAWLNADPPIPNTSSQIHPSPSNTASSLMSTSDHQSFTDYRIKEDFDAAWYALACVCHLTHHLDVMPIAAIARLINTRDIIYQLTHILLHRKWELPHPSIPSSSSAHTNSMHQGIHVYVDGGWVRRTGQDALVVTKPEGLAWMALANLLLSSDIRNRYDITSIRRTCLLRLLAQFDTNPTLMTQLPFLEAVMRSLLHLQISTTEQQTSSRVSSIGTLIEAIPVYIQEETNNEMKQTRDWEQLGLKQTKQWTKDDNQKYAVQLASVYDMNVLETFLEQLPQCGTCGATAQHKCSQCRTQWYCSRQCQVQDWKSHKPVCKMLTSTNTVDNNQAEV